VEYLAPPGVRLLVIDERCQSDRVYEVENRPEAEIVGLIGESEIGHGNDERMPAIKARIEAGLDGRPYLEVVKPE
jgi:hypothetical protein